MSEHVESIRKYDDSGSLVSTKKTVNSDGVNTEQEHGQIVAARIVWYIAGILLVLLTFRFVFALMGANTTNAFANFIYTTSHPFVAPFFSLFSYNLHYGVSRFETFTLVAMAIYALIAYGIVKLVRINRH